jgi:hypothetical protein
VVQVPLDLPVVPALHSGAAVAAGEARVTIFGLLVLLIVLAAVFWLLSAYVVPALPPPIGKVVLAVLALLVVVWLLSAFGVVPGLGADWRVRYR